MERMKMLQEGLPVIGRKACNFTCFKSAVFVTNSKAEDLVTLPGLCSKHTHRHVSSIETFLFHRNFSLSTWNRSAFPLRKCWQQNSLSQGRRIACPQAVSSRAHRDAQAGPPWLSRFHGSQGSLHLKPTHQHPSLHPGKGSSQQALGN